MQTGNVSKSLHTTEYKAFCRFLQSAREHAGLTQAALATAIGKPQSFVSKAENGERRLDVLEFVAICRALGVNPSKLLKRLQDK